MNRVFFERDYRAYQEFAKKRTLLINVKEQENNIKEMYNLLYIFSQISYADADKEINKYILQTKNELILSFDLLNLNYQSVSRSILRSAIETFFRFVLITERTLVYQYNVEHRCFGSTDVLKKLRSNIDTHKIGRMTCFIKEYFKNMPIDKFISDLIDFYSKLSASVHVGKQTTAFHEYIEDYLKIDKTDLESTIKIYCETLVAFFSIIYYYGIRDDNNPLTKVMIKQIQSLSKIPFESFLDQIDEQMK